PNHDIGGIAFIMVGFPTRGNSEVPLVIQRYLFRKPGYDRSLKEIGNYRHSQFLRLPKVKQGNPDSLMCLGIGLTSITSFGQAEAILKMNGTDPSHRKLRRIFQIVKRSHGEN